MLTHYFIKNSFTDPTVQTLVDRTYDKQSIINDVLLREILMTKIEDIAFLSALEEKTVSIVRYRDSIDLR